MLIKRYLTGSCLFFTGLEGFDPHDRDYCELHDDLPSMYVKDMKAEWDVWCWKKALPEEYVDYALKYAKPWQICQFLTPSFCKDVGFTVEHLEQLRPLIDKIDEKHSYEKIIFDAFIENNGYFLTREQLNDAYRDYREKRKYDYFFFRD